MRELTRQEIAFLRELKLQPLWQSILHKLDSEARFPPYKPGGHDTEDRKFHEWVYQSGRVRENQDMLFILQAGVKDG